MRHDDLRQAWSWVVPAALFVALTVVVATGSADGLDTFVAGKFRPNKEWGELQDRFAPWLSHLGPVRMFTLLAVTCLVMAAWRRSWETVVLGTAPALVSVAVTLLVKNALARRDPLGGIAPDGGSYPSGHMVAVVVPLGACLLLSSPRVRWWWWTVVLGPATLMAASLVVTASHWVTDIAGGALLGVAVLAATSRLPLRRRRVPEWTVEHRFPRKRTG